MAFANPEGNVATLGKIEGLHVADLGAGTGAYTLLLAEKVGDTGKVYAVEVQKDFLSKIKNTAQSHGHVNVDAIWGDIEERGGTKLENESVDIVVVANVMFQVDDKMGLVREAKRILKKDGRLLFVDWRDSFGGLGPQPDMIIRIDDARKIFEEAGFEYAQTIETGSRHYGFIVTKK
jgi:ubiquinone/menaquinone biosynthesis C-methylase UbiE